MLPDDCVRRNPRQLLLLFRGKGKCSRNWSREEKNITPNGGARLLSFFPSMVQWFLSVVPVIKIFQTVRGKSLDQLILNVLSETGIKVVQIFS